MREFIRAGIAGIHIEDHLYPKRAHYHKYVVYAILAKEFVDKIRMACRQRNETDKGFVVIARSDTARFRGPAYPGLPQGALSRAVNRADRVRIRRQGFFGARGYARKAARRPPVFQAAEAAWNARSGWPLRRSG